MLSSCWLDFIWWLSQKCQSWWKKFRAAHISHKPYHLCWTLGRSHLSLYHRWAHHPWIKKSNNSYSSLSTKSIALRLRYSSRRIRGWLRSCCPSCRSEGHHSPDSSCILGGRPSFLAGSRHQCSNCRWNAASCHCKWHFVFIICHHKRIGHAIYKEVDIIWHFDWLARKCTGNRNSGSQGSSDKQFCGLRPKKKCRKFNKCLD